jgi:hypothetical protein
MPREISDPEQAPQMAGLPKRVREAPSLVSTPGAGALASASQSAPRTKPPRLPELPKARIDALELESEGIAPC